MNDYDSDDYFEDTVIEIVDYVSPANKRDVDENNHFKECRTGKRYIFDEFETLSDICEYSDTEVIDLDSSDDEEKPNK